MEPLRLAPGLVIARDFEVLRPLSEGGMGAVYVVRQRSTDRRRALKVMHPQLIAEPGLRRRFQQEAQISGKVDSRHVVEVIAAGVESIELGGGTAEEVPWLAMELLKGRDLAALLKQRHSLTLLEVKEIFQQLCDALSAAHRVGVVHRDIKPENIFLVDSDSSSRPFVKILDFGIAKLVSVSQTTHPQFLGTPEWMAPEQTQSGDAIVPATDVWPLGLLAFRMLTGLSYWRTLRQPRNSLAELLIESCEGAVSRATERAREFGIATNLPAGFDAWFARCLDPDARRRFRDANEAFEAISEWEIPTADAAQTALGATDAAAVLQPGNIFAGQYRVIKIQWADMLGPVYKVEQLGTPVQGSLRLLHPSLLKNEKDRTLVVVPNNGAGVVQTLGSGIHGGQPWVLYELQSKTLAEHVAKSGALPPTEAIQLLEQVMQTLETAHGVGVIHRALSPHSITVEPSRMPNGPLSLRILDFRLARRVAAVARLVSTGTATTVCDQEYLQLWAWIAPESLEETESSGHVGEDIWALGLLTYWIIVGAHYFQNAIGSGSLMALLSEILRGVATPASARARAQGRTEALPSGFDAWFARCTAQTRSDRFASVREARYALLALWPSSQKPVVHRNFHCPAPEIQKEVLRPATLPLVPPRDGERITIEKVVALTWKLAVGALLLCLLILVLIGLQSC